MPNWKKLIVSGSDANLNTLNIQTALTASGLNYPDTDGSSGQAITTDGSGNLSFTTISGGGSTDTGSLITTASAAGSTITFTKGDSSTFNVTIAASASSADALVTASISGNTLTFEKGDASTFDLTLPAGGGYGGESATAHHTQSIASETWSFNHGLGDRLPVITVYDNSHNVIIPNTINAVDNDNLDIVFTTARTGYATAVIMGATSSYAHTASYVEYVNVANKPTLLSGSAQIASDISGSFTQASSSFSTRVTNLENFSSSLDATFATDAELNSLSSSVASDIEDIIDGTTTVTSASYALTASHAQNLTISGSIAGVDYIDFSTTSSVPHNEGRLFYDQENGALGFYNEETDITLQIGQEFYKRVYNNSGGVISNGTPVRISGSQGDYPYIWPAVSRDIYSGSYDAQENKIVGVATHNIGINEVGYVTELGVVRGVNTTAFASGDQLFLQTGSAGFRNTPPPFPFDIIPVGEVLRSQSNGFIQVRTVEPITHKNISGVNNIETQVINDESVTIQRGTPVHVVSEGNGPVPRVKIAKANDSNLMPATFVVSDEIPSGSQGYAVSTGYIYDINTSAFTVGDVIYVAPNGGYTNQKPTGSDLIQNLGVVLKVSATEGSGFIYGAGRSNDVPNILPGYAWVGDSNHVATAVATSSFFVTSGSYSHTASFVEFDNIANKPTLLSSSAQIASDISGSFTFLSESLSTRLTDDEASIDALNAATSSYLLNTTDTLTGDLTVTGTITAQEFHTEFVSASIIFQSGSTQFGNSGDDTHTFSGSLNVSGSVTARSFSGLFEGALSSSAQIATEISGAFTSTSASLASNIASNSTRLDTLEGKTLLSSSAQIATEISGAFDSVSSSIATDISNIIDGTTTVASASNALTASYALNAGAGAGFPFSGSAVITGSLFVSGSTISGSFKGDGSQLTGIDIGSLNSVRDTFTNQVQVIVSHNFNSKNINVAVYNSSDQYIIPDVITLTDNNTVTVDFAVTSSGAVVVSKGGHLISGSIPWTQISEIPTGIVSSSAQIATDISGAFDSVSSSLATRLTNQESFSSSLDATFATDADLNIVSSSVDSLNAATSSYALKTEISGAFTATSSSIATDISNIIDGTTTVASASNAITASYALNAGAGSGFPFSGSAVITGSLLASGSVVDFTNATAISGSSFSGSFFGDGTGLSGLGYGDTKKLNQTVAATTWSFSHNMNEQFPTVTVYNDSNEVIQPTKIEGVDAQTLKLYFGVATAGTAVAVVGGTATTQEAGFNRVLTQASAATTWSFEHNLGNKYPQVIVYDSNDEYVIPGKVEAVDQNNLNIYFDIAQSGTATATVGGTSLTASYADSLVITDTLLSTQENTDVDTGTETVATVSTTFYDGAFFDYVAKDGTNYRAGTVMAVWDGSSVQYADNSTADIGDTSGVTLAVDISGTDARLRATTTSDNWNIKAFVRAL